MVGFASFELVALFFAFQSLDRIIFMQCWPAIQYQEVCALVSRLSFTLALLHLLAANA
jgi:hypothetical protein